MWHLPGPGIEPTSPALAGRLIHQTTRDVRATREGTRPHLYVYVSSVAAFTPSRAELGGFDRSQRAHSLKHLFFGPLQTKTAGFSMINRNHTIF